MTDALVEAVARAVSGAEWAAGNGLEKLLYENAQQVMDAKWPDFILTATAALQAIEAAGYRVVPVVATFLMTDSGYEALSNGDGTVADASDCWSAMLSAAPRVGEGV